jgi:hypothetical protein
LLGRAKWGYYNVLDNDIPRLQMNILTQRDLTRPWQDVPALKLARGRSGQTSKLQPQPLQKVPSARPILFFFPRCVISVQLPTFLSSSRPWSGPLFLPYSSSWRPSQTARSLTSRTLSINLKLEYTSSKRDSEMAERNQNVSQTPCE